MARPWPHGPMARVRLDAARRCGERAAMISISPSAVVLALAVAVLLVRPCMAQVAESAAAKPALPSALVPAPRSDAGSIAREQELLRRAREAAPAKVVFVGDSITQAWEGAGSAAWRQHIAPLGALNLGNSGDRTENVLWRLAEAPLTRLQPAHIVLLIGTNNLGHHTSTAAETLAGVEAVVTMLRTQCPAATVHVLEIFPRGERMEPMRGDICQINQALRAFVRATNAADQATSPRLRIHDLGDAFVGADGTIDKAIMPDFLHLSARGYAIWAEAMVAVLQQ